MTHVEFARYCKEKWFACCSHACTPGSIFIFWGYREKNEMLLTYRFALNMLYWIWANLILFTIESNFLPFRNFNSCLYIFFFQLRACDVLKGICLLWTPTRVDITKETVLWGHSKWSEVGKKNIQNKVYSWTAKELQELHTVLHVYCQLIVYVNLDLFDPQAGVCRESSSKWTENCLNLG